MDVSVGRGECLKLLKLDDRALLPLRGLMTMSVAGVNPRCFSNYRKTLVNLATVNRGTLKVTSFSLADRCRPEGNKIPVSYSREVSRVVRPSCCRLAANYAQDYPVRCPRSGFF